MKPTVSVRTRFMDNVDVARAGEILTRLDRCDAPMRLAQIRVLGGATARVPSAATAYAHREAPILVGFLAMDGTAEAAIRHDNWASDCVAAMGGARTGTYINFLADEGDEALRASYPDDHWACLRKIKRVYDPANPFKLNQNIPAPAAFRPARAHRAGPQPALHRWAAIPDR